MSISRSFIILFVIAFAIWPLLSSWIQDPQGSWYRIFIVWLLVLIVPLLLHVKGRHDKH